MHMLEKNRKIASHCLKISTEKIRRKKSMRRKKIIMVRAEMEKKLKTENNRGTNDFCTLSSQDKFSRANP